MSGLLTATQTAPTGESELPMEMVRLQIRHFMSSMERLEGQQAKNLEMLASMLRAQKTEMKQLENEVTELHGLLESHGGIGDLQLENMLRSIVGSMRISQQGVDLVVMAVQGLQTSAKKSDVTKMEGAATGSQGA